MKLAIIPARGGSKRIPRKNVRSFCGRPMIHWSIDAALHSGCFDAVVVSTDDPEIAAVARAAGAEVPFTRPAELSNDYAGTVAVVQHAVNWLAAQGRPAEFVCCLYATAPFVTPQDLRLGLAALQGEPQAAYALSVTSFPFPIQRALKRTPDGRIAMFHPEHLNTRSQDLEEAFHDAGQFYWGRAHAWAEALPVFGPRTMPIVLPRHRVQDIDTPEDWDRAEWMFKALRSEVAP
jgi:N-acylneuraminate cytidylyltransferase